MSGVDRCYDNARTERFLRTPAGHRRIGLF